MAWEKWTADDGDRQEIMDITREALKSFGYESKDPLHNSLRKMIEPHNLRLSARTNLREATLSAVNRWSNWVSAGQNPQHDPATVCEPGIVKDVQSTKKRKRNPVKNIVRANTSIPKDDEYK
jgi:hypothetical protein